MALSALPVVLQTLVLLSPMQSSARTAASRLTLDDSGCSFNGKAQPDGSCRCAPQWKGPQCAELNLVPTPREAVRTHERLEDRLCCLPLDPVFYARRGSRRR